MIIRSRYGLHERVASGDSVAAFESSMRLRLRESAGGSDVPMSLAAADASPPFARDD